MFRCGLLAIYIDLKKGFDSVHRKLPWAILRLMGIPTWFICLVTSLYTGDETTKKSGGGLSSFFRVNSGVSQGYVLVPTLFNVCMDRIMGKATIQSQCEATYGNIKATDLYFAESLESLMHSAMRRSP